METGEEEGVAGCTSLHLAPNPMSSDSISFRSLIESDFEDIKALHDELFPVKYSDLFYTESCAGKGMGGRPLFSSVAISNSRIVGFVLAQFVDLEHVDERYIIGQGNPLDVCYILTIGVRPEYAKLGLASRLLAGCVEYARRNKSCGAIYLHVIHYNAAAIRFYEKNNFEFFTELEDFYLIAKVPYSCFVYVLYLNDCDGPLFHRLYRKTRQKWHSITGWWKSIWETAADQQSHDTTSEVEGERKREQENTAIANHNNNIAQRLLIFENDASDCICSSHYEIDEENMT